MNVSTTKVYLEYTPECENFDEDFQFDVLKKDENCLLMYEVESGEIKSEWFEGFDLSKYKTGEYEVDYEWCTESEYCDGYKMYDYAYVVAIKEMRYLNQQRKVDE